jgi:hypothetical protein
MKFIWTDNASHCRCRSDKPVQIKTRNLSNTTDYSTFVQDMGYILPRDGRFLANVYGSINPETPGEYFDNIDEAKAYVEEHALAGIAINKLTR